MIGVYERSGPYEKSTHDDRSRRLSAVSSEREEIQILRNLSERSDELSEAQKTKKKGGKRIRRFIKWLLLFCFALMACGAGSLVYQGYELYRNALEGESLSAKVREIQEDPDYTPLAELPQTYRNAVVAVEDHRFESHFGIDVISLGRAAWNNIRSMSLAEGGSTITQQLAKNLYFSQEKSFLRKIAEAFMALRIEMRYDKDEILELYVNTIYFGDGYYGIREAARGYYGKEPGELTDGECAMLAGIPNAPSRYAPTQNPELARQRQRQVVRQMIKYGYFTEEEGEACLAEQEQASLLACVVW